MKQGRTRENNSPSFPILFIDNSNFAFAFTFASFYKVNNSRTFLNICHKKLHVTCIYKNKKKNCPTQDSWSSGFNSQKKNKNKNRNDVGKLSQNKITGRRNMPHSIRLKKKKRTRGK